ncbi:MAG: reverse transcriptase/maturase family protein [Bacilli bacterium]|nr:reverse transcriptase/maturase family protein [Bacilli bacterium]
MSKTIRNIFDSKLTFENLIKAHYLTSKRKRCNKYVMVFEIDLETNIMSLYKDLKNKTYKLGRYKEFIVTEPKERLIKALPYRDRIVQSWYIEEFIKPFIVKRFVNDSYACIENKGTHQAVNNLQKYMIKMNRKYSNYYVLKCDIRGFFYNIDKKVLLNILKKYISDKKLLDFTLILLGDLSEIGIPIGNYTSQFFANIYLNELDHYIKDTLNVKYYLRYMDDFILLVDTKEKAKELLLKINMFVNTILHLKLNKKTCYYPKSKGVDFCGYKIFETHKLLRKRCVKKIKKVIKTANNDYIYKQLDTKKIESKLNSFKAHSKHANSYNIRDTIYNEILFREELFSCLNKFLL